MSLVSLDNARVNRADEKFKLVKIESDTMGGTTIRRQAKRKDQERFGSTLCYPDSLVSDFSVGQR